MSSHLFPNHGRTVRQYFKPLEDSSAINAISTLKCSDEIMVLYGESTTSVTSSLFGTYGIAFMLMLFSQFNTETILLILSSVDLSHNLYMLPRYLQHLTKYFLIFNIYLSYPYLIKIK